MSSRGQIRAATAAATVALLAVPAAPAAAVPPRSLGGSGSATFSAAPGRGASPQSSEGLLAFKEWTGGRRLTLAVSGPPDFPLTSDYPRAISVPIKVVDADNASGRCRAGSTGRVQIRAAGAITRGAAPMVIFDLDDCGIHDGYSHGHAGNDVDVKLDPGDDDAAPWRVGFRISVKTRGAQAVKPKVRDLDITYKLATRFYRSFDGVMRYPETKEEIKPDTWHVTFIADPCTGDEHAWSIDGASHTSRGCRLRTTVSKLGSTSVSVSAGARRGSDRLHLRDWLVLGIGDSLASGEGVPDVPKDDNHPAVVWGDRQCHRSFFSHQAKTAHALDQKDVGNSVTFVHLACSGAAFEAGVFGPFGGIEPGAGAMLAGQLFRYRELAGGRKPDAVLVSVGVNHAKFGAVLGYCTSLFESVRFNCRASNVRFDEVGSAFTSDSSGPELQDYVAEKLAELPAMYRDLDRGLDALKVKSTRVYMVAYPDPTRERDGRRFCDDFLSIGPASVDPDDIRWLANSYALKLRRHQLQAAKRYRWNLIDGYSDEFAEHGYCAGSRRWIVTLGDSFLNQGDPNGAVHPNYAGHREIAKHEIKAVLADLL